MKLLDLLGNIVSHVPFLGGFLPRDKAWYRSATVTAGLIWGLGEAISPIVGATFPAAAATCATISKVLHVLGPTLLALGVRKTVVDTANGTPAK